MPCRENCLLWHSRRNSYQEFCPDAIDLDPRMVDIISLLGCASSSIFSRIHIRQSQSLSAFKSKKSYTLTPYSPETVDLADLNTKPRWESFSPVIVCCVVQAAATMTHRLLPTGSGHRARGPAALVGAAGAVAVAAAPVPPPSSAGSGPNDTGSTVAEARNSS